MCALRLAEASASASLQHVQQVHSRNGPSLPIHRELVRYETPLIWQQLLQESEACQLWACCWQRCITVYLTLAFGVALPFADTGYRAQRGKGQPSLLSAFYCECTSLLP